MNKGDRIKYVHTGALDWEEVDEAEADGLLLGDTVTVDKVHYNKMGALEAVRVVEGILGLWISPLHFELVN